VFDYVLRLLCGCFTDSGRPAQFVYRNRHRESRTLIEAKVKALLTEL
jgi:hypothetical protein